MVLVEVWSKLEQHRCENVCESNGPLIRNLSKALNFLSRGTS